MHNAPLCVLLPNPQQPIFQSQRGSDDKNSQIGQDAVGVRVDNAVAAHCCFTVAVRRHR